MRPQASWTAAPSLADYPLIRADAVLGAVFACVISLTIIIATASAIGGTGPLDSAAQAAEALKPVVSPERRTPLRRRPAWRLRPGRSGRPTVGQLRHRRGGRRGALGLPQLP
ncbi:hypothetical protein GCM10020000_47020 [Streptomyces olivoverticillatus]